MKWGQIFWRRPANQILSRALDISSFKAPLASNLLNTLEIVSVTIIEDLQWNGKNWNHTGNQKIIQVFRASRQAYYLQVFQRFSYLRKKNAGLQFLALDLSPIFLDHQYDLPTIFKKDSFIHILKCSVNFYESSV